MKKPKNRNPLTDEETDFFPHWVAAAWTLFDLTILFAVIYLLTGLIP